MGEILQMRFVEDGKDLKVYKLAFAFSISLHRASLAFPKIEQYSLADQMRRASKAICANIVEGFDRQRYSRPEFKRFLMIAASSAAEVGVWLDYSYELAYITKEQHGEWSAICDNINTMLHRLRNKVD
jgi:four helix bundle protein